MKVVTRRAKRERSVVLRGSGGKIAVCGLSVGAIAAKLRARDGGLRGKNAVELP